ncbi:MULTISPECIES: molecular chaperone HtpG [Clostridia]|jgi:molecular chaperone HtpG|uniref:Chaperone HtpG n=1 Tax=Butyribacter intestini TaxID=1703332 RepID=A0AAW3JSJ8_9FIRM|nr:MULTISPECIES: molecular chaperone HtpG [Clostridia]KQC84791.1 chaperone HtpG [Butyribacter intestini]RHP27976.1 molecular chaperone HtpG [Clostridium sp. AF34-13]RHU74067.1 molecular chaperone HtpG [Butyribacter intestini]UYJ41818.1 MAG: molecular chaperone HtpG [Lachnospiraceae bacterium]
MQSRKGSLSIESENMFPIIKKWLYSDHDIFIRELVSNGCDAITKLKKLDIMGEYTLPDDYKPSIQVVVDTEGKSLSFTDTGLGMTEDEVDEYINQVAFSGATDFLEKYKDKANEEQIIGHFGLGFYSAFMVADRVTIDTLSWKEGATPVRWESEGGINFEMSEGDKKEIGTTITLYLSEDSLEFANEYRVREVLTKYCSFMPVEIFLSKEGAEQEYETIDKEELREDDVVVENIVEEAKTEERENENGEKEVVEVSPRKEKVKINKRPVSISTTTPLWMKHPNDCTDDEYKEFYRSVFNDYKEPLFWIHLNMDYPFNLKGILYFPKVNTEYDNLEGVIKLYNNQVFIADNIKEVIPEFLMLLKGVIDCPDLPLNVSRSALQNDGFVKKISDYITKKVADKLSGMYKVDKENYEKYWEDISPFIKYGCLKDSKFREKMSDYIIFKDLNDKYITLPEYVDAVKEKDGDTKENTAENTENTDASENKDGENEEEPTTVYYVTDMQQQSQYVNMFKEQNINAVILSHNIDQAFISQLEQGDLKVSFKRIDAGLNDTMKDDADEETIKKETEELSEIFKKALGKENLEVKVEKLKNENVSSMLTLSEETRRMQDMMKMYSAGGAGMDMDMFGDSATLVLNSSNKLVQYILNNKDAENVDMFCKQLYDLAVLANHPLKAEEMTEFVNRSNEIMLLLAK